MDQSIRTYLQNLRSNGEKRLAVLIDPDKAGTEYLHRVVDVVNRCGIELIFFGGSLLTRYELDEHIRTIKSITDAKVILFPGSSLQVSSEADALLFLSLISGRNPELLIGQHVLAAPMIRQYNLEALSTGYMLVDGGKPTTASYISGTLPLPADKPDIASVTAMAGELLGLQHLYLDAGSGAMNPVSAEIIAAVRKVTSTPLIVGGGMRTVDQAVAAANAGADIVVVGNAAEKNPELLEDIAHNVHAIKVKTQA
ncbi:MAG: geranylgeranylglyceryl/heptaprenylglyceryl phosphate synthase [Bacteroidetes bacterium]|uniref:Geranylgeranylglyceryl phosphate synthase n=1 Tax=Phaeocystidibacter marisrubri TaxID=1577780 RepID=A0A6L3ZEH0_9FLAO|nr:geranylgeranylglyceryl/heptaprenylglyceryl phosphate synthase [Phaeocystidibacter marisrubri]KAB2816080.1 geranylgeranylglyceryl/heptaprenylglyceryl phosphate synthase [Phaeocystidibacter marisrubri]TNE26234.1 MAG: geranylgeranylglyceryl/heptaprenylglyceryl phosphate synthase [Bacteroidota bacterium]GGH67224.1 geranylgeranylglyceryl phosphate synthase [Phaeocystidibacter marisrubri]